MATFSGSGPDKRRNRMRSRVDRRGERGGEEGGYSTHELPEAEEIPRGSTRGGEAFCPPMLRQKRVGYRRQLLRFLITTFTILIPYVVRLQQLFLPRNRWFFNEGVMIAVADAVTWIGNLYHIMNIGHEETHCEERIPSGTSTMDESLDGALGTSSSGGRLAQTRSNGSGENPNQTGRENSHHVSRGSGRSPGRCRTPDTNSNRTSNHTPWRNSRPNPCKKLSRAPGISLQCSCTSFGCNPHKVHGRPSMDPPSRNTRRKHSTKNGGVKFDCKVDTVVFICVRIENSI